MEIEIRSTGRFGPTADALWFKNLRREWAWTCRVDLGSLRGARDVKEGGGKLMIRMTVVFKKGQGGKDVIWINIRGTLFGDSSQRRNLS